MGGRDINDFKEPSHKLEIVLCSIEKIMILGNLIQTHMSIMKYSRVNQNKPPAARTLACSVQ